MLQTDKLFNLEYANDAGAFEGDPDTSNAISDATSAGVPMIKSEQQPTANNYLGIPQPTALTDNTHKFKSGGEVKPKIGYINGKGTGISDSIKTNLATESFIIPADKVKEFGKQFFDALETKYGGGEYNTDIQEARVSNGEYSLSPDTVKAVGVDFLKKLIDDKEYSCGGSVKYAEGGEVMPKIGASFAGGGYVEDDTVPYRMNKAEIAQDNVGIKTPKPDFYMGVQDNKQVAPYREQIPDNIQRPSGAQSQPRIGQQSTPMLEDKTPYGKMRTGASAMRDKGFSGSTADDFVNATRNPQAAPKPQPSIDPWTGEASRIRNTAGAISKGINAAGKFINNPITTAIASDEANQQALKGDLASGDIGIGTGLRAIASGALGTPQMLSNIAKNGNIGKGVVDSLNRDGMLTQAGKKIGSYAADMFDPATRTANNQVRPKQSLAQTNTQPLNQTINQLQGEEKSDFVNQRQGIQVQSKADDYRLPGQPRIGSTPQQGIKLKDFDNYLQQGREQQQKYLAGKHSGDGNTNFRTIPWDLQGSEQAAQARAGQLQRNDFNSQVANNKVIGENNDTQLKQQAANLEQLEKAPMAQLRADAINGNPKALERLQQLNLGLDGRQAKERKEEEFKPAFDENHFNSLPPEATNHDIAALSQVSKDDVSQYNRLRAKATTQEQVAKLDDMFKKIHQTPYIPYLANYTRDK